MTWHLKQPWGLAAFSWDTTGLAPGLYTVHSWTNQIGASTATYETIGSSTVMLTGCSSASVSPSGQSQGAGTTINMTGSGSTGCPNPQFEEWVQYPDGTWHLGRTWGPAAWSWDTSGLRPGPYTIHAWTNQIGASTATYETIGSATVTLTGCTSASVTPSTGSDTVGTPVPFTASSTGCTTAVYEFWVQYPDLSWHLGRRFGANTWAWTTAGLPKGMYTVHVWANNQGAATSPYETIVAATHLLT